MLHVDGLGLRGRVQRRLVRRPRRRGRRPRRAGRLGPHGDPRDDLRRAQADRGHGARSATETLRAGSVSDAVKAGIGLCPEERKSQGLILDEPVYRNITLSTFARTANASFLDEGSERRVAKEQIDALDVRPSDPERAARTLSGGNQQKVLLARWLVHGCRVLLLDEPTRGVDVGARSEIYALIADLAKSGAAVVVVSSEIAEVIGLSDRILVVSEGRVVHDGPASGIDEHRVLDLVMEGSAA